MQFLDLAGVKKFKRYVDENFTTVEEHENAEQVTAAAINDLNERLVDVEDEDWVTADDYSHIEDVIRDYYTKEEVDEKIEEVNSDLSDYYTKYQADDRYLQAETDPTVPAHVKAITSSDISNWNSKTNNTGTVTQVKVGTTPYNPTNGIVSLPEYPITLPASDVPAWAKSPTKPTYTASEVGAASTNYVDTAVAGIVNSAPTTLDTLNELATALGNDPNFATTIATQIGEKVSKTSSTDNAIVRFNGTNGEIQNSSVTVDDNNNIVTAGALYLTNIGSSVSNSTSKLYFGSQSSPYNYITANTSGVFGIYRSSDGKGIACYPNENFFSNSNIDLGRTQSLWKNLYLSGTIGNGTHSLTLPNKSGTIATMDDIPAAQVQSDWNATTGMGVILNKPTIPAAVTESTVSGWGFAKTASPALTGTPTAPTAAASTNNTQIATTAFVKTAINNIDLSDYVDYDTYDEDQETIAGALTDLSTNKQATLVSGTNIKTINNESLLGSGNIVVENFYFVQGSSSQAGNATSGSYLSTKWEGTVPGVSTAVNGLKIAYRIATNTGVSTAGVVLSIDGTNYYPVVIQKNTIVTTHYPVGTTVLMVFNSTQTATAYLTSNTKSTVTGCWQIMEYDSNTNTYQRVYVSSNNVEYPITTRYNISSGDSYYAEYGRYSEGVTLNPSTNTITAGSFKIANGTSSQFLKADGSVDSNTYALASSVPSAVTESTVSGWGFTKNTGTYSKPSGGIPATDLASAVQTSLGKADTALQSFTETDPVFSASAAAGITASDVTNWNGKTSNTGTVTGVKINGTTKNPTSGVVDLGTVITSETSLSKGTTSGNGNAVTDISVSGHQITLTKGSTFLTSETSLSKGTTSGNGNAVTDISVSGHQITLTKGTTFLTSHQDISGKANLSGAAFTGAVTGTSSGNTAQFRNITISSSEPTSSQGSNGDIWIVI